MKKIICIGLIALIMSTITGCDTISVSDATSTPTSKFTVSTPPPSPTLEPPTQDVEGDISFSWDSCIDISYSGNEDVTYYLVSIDGNNRKTDSSSLYTGENEENRLIKDLKISAYDVNNTLLDECIFYNVYFDDSRCDITISKIVSKYPQIERLFLFNRSGETINLSHVGKLKNLKQLFISDSDNVNDFNLLGDLPYLEDLRLEWAADLDLNFLRNYSGLKRLEIDSPLGYFHDIDALSELTNLEYLNLNGYDGDNVDALSSLNRLKHLTLYDFTGTNIDGISSLTNLEYLLIFGYQGESLNNLSNLINLKYLELEEMNNVNDISPISNLIQIESLFLDNLKKVTNIDAIRSLSNLEYLRLSNMPNIENSNALGNLTNLKKAIIHCRNFNLQALSLLKSIEILSFSHSINIESISNLTNLKSLSIYLDEDCEMKNSEWLSNLINLEKLSINNKSNITDFSCLSGLKNLRYLYLYENSIDLRVLRELESLETLNITLDDDRDFRFIADMDNLIDLEVAFGGAFPNLLGKLQNLKKITLSEGNGNILNLEPLCDLENLVSLIIPWTEYMKVNLTPIEEMTQLEVLEICCYTNEEFPNLSKLDNLKELYIFDFFDVYDLDNIFTNTNIEILCINDSSLNDISSIVNMTNLKTVSLFHTEITDYTPLLNLENLENVSIGFPSVDEKDLAYFYDVEGLEVEIR